MEAVPKLSMLFFGLKYSPENTDFILKMKRLIHTNYGEDPESFGRELGEIGVLRSNACIRPTQDFAGIAALKKYYCQLNFLKSRFKIKGGSDEIFAFPWYDVYHGALYTFSDFHYEMASVLYNIGALHSILGSREDRTTSDGMKVACTHFQCAAWAFHTLPDRYRTDTGTDMSPELLAFLSQVCLAQAQECILEKSILDHRKSSIIAKVGAQVADYYQQAFRKIVASNLERDTMTSDESIAEIVGTKISRSWTHYVEFKMCYYNAVSYLYQGIQSEENQKMGERITYFEKAAELLAKSGKLAQKVDNEMISKTLLANSLTFSSDVINGKLDISKRENEFVYHEKVPDFDSLPELRGASLVKGMGFEITDPEISGPDIFAKLVPLEAHEASSLYSEEKAQILRLIGSEIEGKNESLEVFLSTLSLSEVPRPGDHLALPQELIEAAAGLSVHKEDTVKKLIDAMSSIASVAGEVQVNISCIREILADEQTQENEYTDIVGPRPSPRVDEFDKECSKYEEAHRMASESNITLHNAMRLHVDNLRLLSKPLDQLQKEIPSMADLDDGSESNIAEVHRLLNKIDEMKAQRNMFFEQLRQALHEDDITEKLLVQKNNEFEKVFKVELQKHDHKRQLIQKNLNAQDNILQALKETNARYASTRKIVAELINARNELIGSLVASFYAYDDLLQKASNGLMFYSKLNENVLKLTNKVKAYCKVQQEERDAVLAKHHDLKKSIQNPAFVPGLPHFHEGIVRPSNSMPGIGSPSVPILTDKIVNPGGGRPTLKDYLDMMKANKGTPGGSPSTSQSQSGSTASPGSNYKRTDVPEQQPQAPNDQLRHFQPGYTYPYTQHALPHSYSPSPASTPPPAAAPHSSVVGQSMEQDSNSNSNDTINPSVQFKEGENFSPHLSSSTGKHEETEKVEKAPATELRNNFQSPDLTRFSSGSIPGHPSHFPIQQPYIYTGFQGYPGTPQFYQYPQIQGNYQPTQGPHSHPTQFRTDSSAQQQVQPQVPTPSQLQASVQPRSFAPSPSQALPTQAGGHLNGQLQSQPPVTQSAFPTQGPVPSQSHGLPTQTYPSQFQYLPQQGVQTPQLQMQMPRPQMQSTVPTQPQQNFVLQGQPTNHPGGQIPHNAYNPQFRPGAPGPSLPQFQQQYQTGFGNQPVSNHVQHPSVVSTTGQHVGYFPGQQQNFIGQRPPNTQSAPTEAVTSQAQYTQGYQQYVQPPTSIPNQVQHLRGPIPQGQTMQNQFVINQQQNFTGQRPDLGLSQGYIHRHPYQQYPGVGLQSGPFVTQSGISSSVVSQGTTVPTFSQAGSTSTTIPSGNGPQFSPYNMGVSSQQFQPGPQQMNQEPKLRAVVPQPGTVPLTPMIPLQPVTVPQQGYLPVAQTIQVQPQSYPSGAQSQHTLPNPLTSQPTDHHRKASFDELLNENFKTTTETGNVLQPKVMTASELQELKIEAQAREDIAKASAKDPYDDPSAIQKILEELKDLEAIIDDKAMVDTMWKQVLTLAGTGSKVTVSVARCYPMKNRVPDVMPFDQTRVELPGTKDDYINASRIKHLTTHSPNFVATQAPTPNTLADFWTMVWQEQVEILICLLSDVPDVYWPSERKEPLKILESLEVTLQSVKVETHWTERILTVRNKESNTSRVVIQLQLSQSSSPTTSQLDKCVAIASSTLNYVRQQRVFSHPVVVHCLDGSGKTALFCLIMAALAEVNVGGEKSGKIIPDLVQLSATLSQQRKGVLRDKEIFKQALQGVAKYTRDLLVQKGVLEAKPVILTQQKPQPPPQNDLIQSESNVRLLASQFGFEPLTFPSTDPVPHTNVFKNETNVVEREKFFTPDLSRFADLSLDPLGKGSENNCSPQRKKISKQDFLNKGTTGLLKNEGNSDDPLSQLDPLWSLK